MRLWRYWRTRGQNPITHSSLSINWRAPPPVGRRKKKKSLWSHYNFKKRWLELQQPSQRNSSPLKKACSEVLSVSLPMRQQGASQRTTAIILLTAWDTMSGGCVITQASIRRYWLFLSHLFIFTCRSCSDKIRCSGRSLSLESFFFNLTATSADDAGVTNLLLHFRLF